MNLQVDISWPSTLPIPSIDFSGKPRNATLVSSAGDAAIVRRSRFEKSYSVLSVGLCLTSDQIQIFKDFYLNDLGNGTAQFKIELRFPKTSELTEWAVRFDGGYQSSCDDGRWWEVKASLELLNPTDLNLPTYSAIDYPYEDFEQYLDGAEMDGRDGGFNWGGPWVDSDNPYGIKCVESFESYADGVGVNGLNGGSGWGGPWVDN